MPIDRPARTVIAVCLALASLLAIAAAPAAALEPPRPLPEYRAAFVTETDQRPMRDCLWASASMLLDKWTNGKVIRTHEQLRALSGDAHGGSTFQDLHVAFAKLGFSVPDNRAGNRLSWGELLTRLRRGAGAIVLGDYGQLPSWYGRWSYGFWKNGQPLTHKQKVAAKAAEAARKAAHKPKSKAKPPNDNHAVYVERYDARRGRVWLMDPLGRGHWHGEWLSVRALKRFAWFSGGSVFAVTTPVAAPPPYKGVRFVGASMGLSDDAVTATWRIRGPRKWRYPGADVHVSMTPATSPLEAAAQSALVGPVVTLDPAPAHPTSGVQRKSLRIRAALPTSPGVYLASMSLTDRRFGRQVVASDQVAVFVPGKQRATVRLNVNDSILTAGGSLQLNASVANAGESTWAEASGPDGDDAGRVMPSARARDTRLVAHWIRLDDPVGGPDTTDAAGPDAGDAASVPGPLSLMGLPLAPREQGRFRGEIPVPDGLGHWALVLDVEDAIVGSYAALGSAPAVALFEVVPPRGIEPID